MHQQTVWGIIICRDTVVAQSEGQDMRPTTRKLVSVCILPFIASVVGLVLALIFQ